MSASTAPTGTDALFGVVQTALTIGSVIPLVLAVVALVILLRTRRAAGRAGPMPGRSSEHAQRLHDLARVSLLGSAFGLALLLVGQLIVGLGTSIGLVAAFAGPLVPVNIGAIALTVVAAVAYAASPAPGR